MTSVVKSALCVHHGRVKAALGVLAIAVCCWLCLGVQTISVLGLSCVLVLAVLWWLWLCTAWPYTEDEKLVDDVVNKVCGMTDSQVERALMSNDIDEDKQPVTPARKGGPSPTVQVLSMPASQSSCEDTQTRSPLCGGTRIVVEAPDEELG